MPVIVMASAKGGAGKSTCSVLLATGFARLGAKVTILDCDPSQALSRWARRGLPSGIRHGGNPGPSEIIKAIQEADGDGNIVIVDLEGVASQTVSRAISQADLVLVPMQATALDAEIGSEALALVREEEEALRRKIRHAVVLTKTSAAVRSRVQRDLEEQLAAAGIDVINPTLVNRAAFGELFALGGDLQFMAADPNVKTGGRIEGAIENAEAFTEAVYRRLQEEGT
ncbi:MAG: ParA family protein [Rhodobacteraceae bacterium]|nr:ParA family protein [Paracoccaceae bacterium]MCY4141442.1 ParA family protein [Paracoccaceae bacterium]